MYKYYCVFLLVCALAFAEEAGKGTCPESNAKQIEYYSKDLPLVILDYNDLVNRANLQALVATAYGQEGLGILLVRNVPGLKEKREELLKLARSLAYLTDEQKQEIEHPQSLYSVGWSHGKEKLAKDQPDFSKGSFYANPLTDDPTNGNREWISQYPSFYHPNLWPVNSLPQLQSAFMETGQLVHEIGKLIAYQMDQLVSSVRPQYVKGTLVDVVGTNLPKGRLLYYFSSDEMKKFNLGNTPHGTSSSTSQGSSREDNWCGWHNDHSSLTGL
ncbi:hypothetical protein RFI_37102, partial [Reticulomyxa filosa]